MWINLSQLVVCFYFCTAVAYYESKQDYINRRKPSSYIRQKVQPSVTTTTTDKSVANRNNNYHFNSNSNHNFNFFNNKNFVAANKVRHQSRFSKFDVVKTMIDSRTIPKPVSSSSSNNNQRSSNYNSNRRRHSGSSNYYRTTTTTTTTTTTPDEGLFDNDEDDWDLDYEDDDGELDDDIYLDDDNDNDDNKDENNDDLFSDNSYNIKSTTIKTIPNYQQSRLTAYKWEHFGTKEKVNETRRQFFNHPDTREDLNAYLKHLSFVKTEGECRKPLKRVISVQSEHPDLSKIYTPTCTVLYRCSEDTGCCNNNTKCQYKKRVVVHLYFIVHTVGNTGTSGTKVEKLSFYNHTECECRSKNSNYTAADEENENGVAGSFKTTPENLKKCKCPDHFTPKIKFDLTCTCVCEDDNQDCIRMKKGKEYFGLTTRMCIMNNNCGIPLCEYGKYMKQSGRCPKKDEKMDVYKKINVN